MVVFSKIFEAFQWCFRPDKNAMKHRGWLHPLFSIIFMGAACILTCTFLANRLFKKKSFNIPDDIRKKYGSFLSIYLLIMIGTRLATEGIYCIILISLNDKPI